jgi:uncharacterized protein YneF (UPF0154 family)
MFSNFRDYLAGAALSFSLMVTSIQFISFYVSGLGDERGKDLISIIFDVLLIINVLGAALSGFLVARKVEENYFKVGIIVAVLSYILETAYFLAFNENHPQDLLLIGSLISGAVIGSFFSRKHTRLFTNIDGSEFISN